jgi:uncharacterized protein (DUF362 family)
LAGFAGKRVALKANYNSADPFPGSSLPDTLRAIVEVLKKAGVILISRVFQTFKLGIDVLD